MRMTETKSVQLLVERLWLVVSKRDVRALLLLLEYYTPLYQKYAELFLIESFGQ